jgi:hypothetical protein
MTVYSLVFGEHHHHHYQHQHQQGVSLLKFNFFFIVRIMYNLVDVYTINIILDFSCWKIHRRSSSRSIITYWRIIHILSFNTSWINKWIKYIYELFRAIKRLQFTNLYIFCIIKSKLSENYIHIILISHI